MLSIWKRELQGYFYTPVGYVFMGVFLLLSSVIFFLTIMQTRSSDLLTFIGTMSYLWMLLCPVLTMRLLAEERQKRTYSPQVAYDYFCRELENMLYYTFGLTDSVANIGVTATPEKSLLRSVIIAAAHIIYLEHSLSPESETAEG